MEKVRSCPVLLFCLILLLLASHHAALQGPGSQDPPSPLGNPASAPVLLDMNHLFSEV